MIPYYYINQQGIRTLFAIKKVLICKWWILPRQPGHVPKKKTGGEPPVFLISANAISRPSVFRCSLRSYSLSYEAFRLQAAESFIFRGCIRFSRTFSRTGSVRFLHRSCSLLCTTGIHCQRLLQSHLLQLCKQVQLQMRPLLQEPV